MENVNALTGQNLYPALLVLVALCGLFILFVNTVEAARKLKRPGEKRATELDSQQKSCDRKFANDQRMLEEQEKQIEAMQKRLEAVEEGFRVQCTALHALLEHELHNGNAEEMQNASKALFEHLNHK